VLGGVVIDVGDGDGRTLAPGGNGDRSAVAHRGVGIGARSRPAAHHEQPPALETHASRYRRHRHGADWRHVRAEPRTSAVRAPGPLLASGRDADIFEYGPGLVLRRSRAGRPLADGARVMEYVRAHGFPVPAVEELGDDGASMVMERLDGMDMVASLAKRPWTVTARGRVLDRLDGRVRR
jgi:hypothetical protein